MLELTSIDKADSELAYAHFLGLAANAAILSYTFSFYAESGEFAGGLASRLARSCAQGFSQVCTSPLWRAWFALHGAVFGEGCLDSGLGPQCYGLAKHPYPLFPSGLLLGGNEIHPGDEHGTVPGPWLIGFAVHVLNFCFVSPTRGRCLSISTLRVPIQWHSKCQHFHSLARLLFMDRSEGFNIW